MKRKNVPEALTLGILTIASVAAVLPVRGVEPWQNPAVNSINRLPARTYAMPLADESAAWPDALQPEPPFCMAHPGR